MKDKIAIVHLAHWEQLLGGAEQQLQYMAEFFSSHGHEVHIIYPNRNNRPVVGKRIQHHALKKNVQHGLFGKTWHHFQNELIEAIEGIGPDLIITRTYSSWAGIVAELAKDIDKKHYHFIASDSDVTRNCARIPWWKYNDRQEFTEYEKVYNGKTKIIVQNDFQQSEIFKKYQIDTVKANQCAPSTRFVSGCKKNEPLTVVWVANFKSIKRPEKYLSVVKKFADDERVEFVMIGGYRDEKYERMLQPYSNLSNFTYLGEVGNDKVNSVFEGAHILINTSDYEGFSNTFVQAWLREVVVLSFNSNPNNVLTKHRIGFLTGGLNGAVEEIELAISDISTILEMGKTARSFAVENHTIDKVYPNLFFNDFS